MREAPSSKLAGEEHRQHHTRGSGQRRQRPQGRQRAAEKESNLRVNGDQGRAVHVAPVEVAATVEEIELVPEVTVPAGGHQVDEKLRSQKQRDEPKLEWLD